MAGTDLKIEFSKSKLSKIQRKQKRCQALVTKETNLIPSQTPTKFLGVCNAGLSTGLQSEIILEEIIKYGKIEDIIMISNKSYCFIECSSSDDALKIFNGIHGHSKLGQDGAVLYLSYFNGIPSTQNSWHEKHPSGLHIIKDFVTEDEEKSILNAIKANDDNVNQSSLKHREVKHFGYEFLYGKNNIDIDKPLDKAIPNECTALWPRLKSHLNHLESFKPDQLTVNIYSPGQGIPPHVDTHSAFLDPILSLSLESDIVMEFRRKGQHIPIVLPRRSLLVMSGESRYDWTHGITPRHMDVVPSDVKYLTIQHRQRRTSLTFRQLRKAPCDCIYHELCDTYIKNKNVKRNDLKDVAAELEVENVHKVYDEIANHFSETRHKPWPKVEEFLNSFDMGAILLDVGCGNGKYLGINQKIIEIGCDRSDGLLQVCCSKNFNVFRCDCLSLPFRSNSIDGCISIAVIHHLATEERRVQAITEMARILRNNGKGLIYVWAKNQEADFKKSSYLRQNKKINKNNGNSIDEKKLLEISKNSMELVNLPVHKNRTQFVEQDVFVPWKLKTVEQNIPKNEFLRYYHVFEEQELENLCSMVDGVKVESCYYDQGNWCVIFRKL